MSITNCHPNWAATACAIAFAAICMGAAAQPAYQFEALHQPDDSRSGASALNGHGAVVGTSTHHPDAVPHATLWRWHMPLILDEPGQQSNALGVNRYLEIVGISDQIPGTGWQATLWSSSGATLLPNLGGSYSYAYAINNSHQIAGGSALAGDLQFHAVRWTNGVPADLGTLGGATSIAYAMNSLGDAVGISRTSGGHDHAAMWTADGAVIDLGSLTGGFSSATAINRRRWAAGYSDASDGHKHATLWHDGLMIDLGTLAQGLDSFAWGIGPDGTVVGHSFTTPKGHTKERRATLWRDGAAIDLNTLMDDASRAAGWVLMEARAINDDGVITGGAKNTITGKERVFRLTPL